MSQFLPVIWGVGSALAIAAGGLLASRLTRHAGKLLGIAGGMVFGIALFDLLPEAYMLAGGVSLRTVLVPMMGGFLGYMALDALSHDTHVAGGRLYPHVGPLSLALHAIIDGFMIGVGFDVSAQIGFAIAIAVLAHGLVHGINTIVLARSRGGDDRFAHRWLAVNAGAPLVGIAISRLISVTRPELAILIAGVAGAFVQIATGELLPAARRGDGIIAFAAALVIVGGGTMLLG